MNTAAAVSRPLDDLLPTGTHMGAVELRVRDLDVMTDYYHQGVGLDVIEHADNRAVLGLGGHTLLTLEQVPGLPAARTGQAGLYHNAFLYPTQQALALGVLDTARHIERTRRGSFTGTGDHLVSEAFYFDDPEGNGVELYWDRPADQWRWDENGHVAMATLFVDPNEFLSRHLPQDLDTAQRPGPLHVGMGHVHLSVGDTGRAKDFYAHVLGFSVTTEFAGQALFVSAGGYHHHMAMNIWNSRDASARAATLGLGTVDIAVPTLADIAHLRERATDHGLTARGDEDRLLLADPWGTEVRISAHG